MPKRYLLKELRDTFRYIKNGLGNIRGKKGGEQEIKEDEEVQIKENDTKTNTPTTETNSRY